jgi:hypothetical protein
VPVPGLADIWDYLASDEDSADPLVLGRVLNDHGQARRVRSTSAASVGPNLLRDRLDDAAQAPPGNGKHGEGAFARRGRDG